MGIEAQRMQINNSVEPQRMRGRVRTVVKVSKVKRRLLRIAQIFEEVLKVHYM